MHFLGIGYYLRYYKNWIISFFIFTILFCMSVFFSYFWSLNYLGWDNLFLQFLVESFSYTLFIYTTVIFAGIVLIVLVKLLGFFRKHDLEILLKMTTDQLLAENQATEEELSKFQEIVGHGCGGVFITHGQRIVYTNTKVAPLVNCAVKELVGRRMVQVACRPEEFKKLFERAVQSLTRKNTFVYQVNLTTITGAPVLYQISAFYLNPQNKQEIAWIFQNFSAETRNIELEKYYQTVFRVLTLLHEFNEEDDENVLLQQMLSEVIGIYGLKTAFLLSYRNKKLHVAFVVGDERQFPNVRKELDLTDESLTDVAAIRAFVTRRPIGYKDITYMPYYRKSFMRHRRLRPVSTYAFPLLIDGEVEGVISLYGYTEGFFTDSLIFRFQQLLSEICENISAIRMRRRAHIALRRYEERLREQIHELEDNKKVMQKQADALNGMIADLVEARDAAEAANKAKSEFLANMSHEVRTPLNAILGFSEAMISGTFGPLQNPQYEEYIQYIYSSGKLLLSLINDILDLSSIESGHQKLSFTPLNPKEVLENVLEVVQAYPGATERHISLKTTLPATARILADERALKQICLNLLSNAIKFTQVGGHIHVSLGLTPDKRFRLTCSDDGIGIPADKIKTLFQPFTQVENFLTRAHKGTGLGLVLIKRLVELHQGTVSLKSKEGQGTMITVTFPKNRVMAVKKGVKK